MPNKKRHVFAKVMIGHVERSYRGASLKQVAEIAARDIMGWKYKHGCSVKLWKPKKCPSGNSVCTDGEVVCPVANVFMTGGRNPKVGARYFRNKRRNRK